jgi:hypothetical protein
MSLHRRSAEALGRDKLTPSALETFDVYDKAALDISKSTGGNDKSYFDQMHEMMTKSGHNLVDYESGEKDMVGHSLGGRAPEDITAEPGTQGTRASYQDPKTGDVRQVRNDTGLEDYGVHHHDKKGWDDLVARKAQRAEDRTLHPTLQPDRSRQSLSKQILDRDIQRDKDIEKQEVLASKDPYGKDGPASQGYKSMTDARDRDRAERRSNYTPEVESKYQDEILAVSRETARAKAAGDTKNYEAGKAKYKEISDDHKAMYGVKSIPPREKSDWSKLSPEERDAAAKQALEDNNLSNQLSLGQGNDREMAKHLGAAIEGVTDRTGAGVGLSPEQWEEQRQRMEANHPEVNVFKPSPSEPSATASPSTASATAAPTPSAIESAVESAAESAPEAQPAASKPAAAPEKTLNRAQKKALEAQQKRAAAAAQASAAPAPSAIESAVESASENAPESISTPNASAEGPGASPKTSTYLDPEGNLREHGTDRIVTKAVDYSRPDITSEEAKAAARQGSSSAADDAATGAPVSAEKQPLAIRRITQEEYEQNNTNYESRTRNHPDWETATENQQAKMMTQGYLSEIDDYEARGQKHPLLYTDDDWSELYSKEDEATRTHHAKGDEWYRKSRQTAEDALRVRQVDRDYEEEVRNRPSAPAPDPDQKLYDDFEASQQRARGSDPDFYVDENGVTQEGRAARAATEAVDDASTGAPKAGATASKGAKITTGAEAARTGANGMRTGSGRVAGGRRFNVDVVDRQLDLTTRGIAGTVSSVINDYGLNRRALEGGGHVDTLFGKGIRVAGRRVSWASAEYAAPVFNAAEKEAKWAMFKTAEEAAESWADEIEGRAAQGGTVNKIRHGFYKALGGRGSEANKMMTKVGGFGTVLPVAFNAIGVAVGASQGYREGGVGGAMLGGAKGLVTNAVHGQMIGAALSHPLLMLGGASLMMASYKVGHGIFDVRTRGNNYLKMGRSGGLSWNTGSTPGMDSQVASTMRGRALMSMENSRFNAMKSLGNESYMMTAPSARYGNSTQIGSQQPMLAY